MSGTGIFIIAKNKEFICVRKLFMNDSSQKIEKREKLCYTLKNALHLVVKYESIIENLGF